MALAIVVPPVKTVRISWNFPVKEETPDLVFKLYHSSTFAMPVDQWPVLTNVPGNLRSVVIVPNKVCDFFVLTASNYFGESDFATR